MQKARRKDGFMKRATLFTGFFFAAFQSMAFAQGNADNGKAIFAGRCGSCHYVVKDRGNPLGPNLDGFFGRPAASEDGFSTYSEALKKSGLVWNEETLDKWLTSPSHLVPGTRMAGFPGLTSETQRADVIAYLSALK
jgi:cytochrome c